jgi:phosphatidyl-myo-inositol alpha-mannosyltransferase
VRIALVCPYSLSHPGGVQGQVSGLARAFVSMGHDAVVVAPTDGDVAVAGLGPGAVVSAGRSVGVHANGSVAPISLDPAAWRRGARAVKDGAFDVVNIHEPLAPGAGYGCLLLKDVAKVGTFHRAGAGMGYRALGPLARWAAGHLQVRCAVSPEARATAASVLGGSYEVLGNGVELDRFDGAVPWPKDGPTIVFIGRHEPRKGLSDLLAAFTVVRRDRPCTLWICGVGPETTTLRHRFPPDDGLEWLGALGDDELASRLAGADVVCAPSRHGESFGVVLVEAMAAGTAVLASDLPGYADVVGSHGRLFAAADVGALTASLDSAVADAASGTGMCAPDALAAASVHAKQWSMESLATRYLQIFGGIVGPLPSS